MPLLLAACVAYFNEFAADLARYSSDTGLFQFALNWNDHGVYLRRMTQPTEELLVFRWSNDNGIALLYGALATTLPFLVRPDFALLALFFNCFTLCVVYVVWARICDDLELGGVAKLAFFANWSVIYFAQLINKDMLTILAFLLAVHWGIRGTPGRMLWVAPFFALVRQQMALFAVLYFLFMRTKRPMLLMFVMYVATSLAGGVISAVVPLITVDSLGDGLSLFLVDFNRQYYVGYLIFNPIRVLQYVYDALLSFDVTTDSGGIETARLLRWPQLILLLCLAGPLSQLVTRFRDNLQTPARAMTVTVVAYLMTWLLNPTVNSRYVMLITPVLVLFALHVSAVAKRQRQLT
jgi:hypothetical protein